MREGSGVGNPPQSEQTARFGCTVTVLFNTRRDTKETDIKMEKSTRHASNERAGDRLDIVFPLLKFATTTYGGRSKSCGAPCTMMDTQTFRSTTTHGLLFFFSNIAFHTSIHLRQIEIFFRASPIFPIIIPRSLPTRLQSLQLLSWNTF